MTSYGSIVAAIQDRFAWWASPPASVRPTPALAGWTLEEWIAQSGILEASPHERFQKQFPGRIELHGHDHVAAAVLALRKLVTSDVVEVVPGRSQVWRARVRDRRAA